MKKILITSFFFIVSINLYAQTSGGPDAFGYVWRDSNDPNGPVYNWIDITGLPGAVQITGLADDNNVGPFPIGFPFDYYAGSASQFWVGSNGYIGFTNGVIAALGVVGFPNIPDPSGVDNFIAPFMTDLNFLDTLAQAWYYTSPGNDTLIVSWIHAPFWENTVPPYSGSNTFQVILVRSNGSIVFQYEEQTGVSSATSTNPVSIGIENSDGFIGLNPLVAVYPPVNYAIAFYGLPVNHVYGSCFIDINQNGVRDTSETGHNHLLVTSTGGYNQTTMTDNDGYFYNRADTGTTVTTLQNLFAYTASPTQHVSNFTTYNNADTVNFGLVPIPGVDDLTLNIFPLSPARPGFYVIYRIYYTNIGSTTLSGNIYFTKDNLLIYTSSTGTVININGDTIVFSYNNLAPLHSGTIDVTFLVPTPPTVNFGDILTLSAYIDPLLTDTNPENNSMLIHQTVRGSMDPNDKTMLGGSYITPTQVADGDYMDYLIRFQNTGTDTAFTVIVKDTLSSNLQWNTLEMVTESHPYTLTITDGNILSWQFNNINLPDSTANEPASHGYIAYRIKPQVTLGLGTSISNTAHIYFDFNLPVKTNTEQTVVGVVGINENSNTISGITVYPNPNNGEFNIDLGEYYDKSEIKIFNMLSQVSYEQTYTNQRFVNASIDGASGMYFIQINTNKGSQVLKVIKQ